MDEVDGRPGHVALQFGHLDAPKDAPALSLSLLLSTNRFNECAVPPSHRRWGPAGQAPKLQASHSEPPPYCRCQRRNP